MELNPRLPEAPKCLGDTYKHLNRRAPIAPLEPFSVGAVGAIVRLASSLCRGERAGRRDASCGGRTRVGAGAFSFDRLRVIGCGFGRRYSDAVRMYKKALALRPEYHEALNDLVRSASPRGGRREGGERERERKRESERESERERERERESERDALIDKATNLHARASTARV
jgi:hypothetical protein